MDEPKNVSCYSKKNEFNDFEIEYIWEFILDNQYISIIYIHNLELNKRKILFKQRLIKEEIFYGNNYTYEFYEKGHNYKIIHKKDILELYIDFEYFKSINSFENDNNSKNSSFKSSKMFKMLDITEPLKNVENKERVPVLCVKRCSSGVSKKIKLFHKHNICSKNIVLDYNGRNYDISNNSVNGFKSDENFKIKNRYKNIRNYHFLEEMNNKDKNYNIYNNSMPNYNNYNNKKIIYSKNIYNNNIPNKYNFIKDKCIKTNSYNNFNLLNKNVRNNDEIFQNFKLEKKK